ncbi:MAG: HAMP domain-containing sensor histidine kinase [Polyangiaceae bacterium]
MRAKRLSGLAALGCGCFALIWGLVHLHSIFREERQDALDAIFARQRAIAEYAHQELSARLNKQRAQARPAITAAREDPLLPAKDIVLIEGGKQRLPRVSRFAGHEAGLAWRTWECLRAHCDVARVVVPWPTEGPFQERLATLRALEKALTAVDRDSIEDGVRKMLSLRALYVIDVRLELPLALVMVEQLTKHARPDRKLMSLLLRDGYARDGVRLEGLQRMLLSRRDRFSEHGFSVFGKRIMELSEPAGVAVVDFRDRFAERFSQLELPKKLDEPSLVREGQGLWFLTPERGRRIVGVRVELFTLVAEIERLMMDRKLIEAGDGLHFEIGSGVTTLSSVVAAANSSRWATLTQAAESRYRLKSLLEFIVALLSFGVVALSVIVYRRRNRFLELKSEFVSAVSHELRTPLASIRLMAETLERRTKGVEGARDYPTRIVRDVEGLSFLVENILSFDRLQHGRWVPKLQRVLLSDIVDKLDRDRDTWARREAELEREGLDELVLDADPDLLLLLLTNLARNAVQYGERDPAVIGIVAEASGGRVVIRVRDNGVGIPDAQRERVFDDFYRATDPTGRGERGSGLGLSICRKIVEAHEGVLSVAETGPKGTTFEMSFAAAAPIEHADEAEES